MMVWALGEARRHGYPVRDALLAEVDWLVAEDESSKVFPQKDLPPERDFVSVSSIYVAWMVDQAAVPAADKLREMAGRKIAPNLVEKQEQDGSFASTGRPPILEPRETISLWTDLALHSPLLTEVKEVDLAPVREKLSAWIDGRSAGPETQEVVLRIVRAQQQAQGQETIDGLVQELTSRQHEDGGWGQMPEQASDAFATGQALYALGNAGAGSEERVAQEIERAREFLRQTQLADGSWLMSSRAVAGQEPPPPEKHSEMIMYPATGWAVLGLLGTGGR